MKREIAWGALAGLLALFVALSIASRLGLVTVTPSRPATAELWSLSRAAGVVAYLALTGSVIAGMLMSSGAADGWIARARVVELHRWVASLALALAFLHPLALVGDRFARFDALDLLVPFLASQRRVAVGLGVLAAQLAVVVHLSFSLRARLGRRAFRALHALAFPAWLLATLHGLWAGTDRAAPWATALYATSATLVLGLGLIRLRDSMAASIAPASITPARAEQRDERQRRGGRRV